MKLDGEFNRAKTNKAYQLITWFYCDLFLNWIKSLKEEENSINIHKKLYIETKYLKLTTAIYPKILIIIILIIIIIIIIIIIKQQQPTNNSNNINKNKTKQTIRCRNFHLYKQAKKGGRGGRSKGGGDCLHWWVQGRRPELVAGSDTTTWATLYD